MGQIRLGADGRGLFTTEFTRTQIARGRNLELKAPTMTRAFRAIPLCVFLSLAAGTALHPQSPVEAQAEPAAPRRQLIEYLNSLASAQLDGRAREVARIGTRADAVRRQAAVRSTVLRLIGGLPADRGPLAVRTLGAIEADGFRIEKITYESLPGMLVTANLYVPSNRRGPFPAVVLTPGHDPTGKAGLYSFAANLSRAGIAVLAYDPISEGERFQHYDPELGASKVGRVTGEHSHAGVQTLLIGDHVSRYFVWDAMRGIDYLTSRADIDADRIGAFGCSGGGTVTAYLTAMDDRVKVAAVACYLTGFRELLTEGDPQEGEQSIPDFLASGLDLGDWVQLAAPRPYAIVSTTEDMFPFEGARRVYQESKRIYGLYDAEDRLTWITGPGGHGALGPIAPEIIAFFARWLKTEPPQPAFIPLRPDQAEDLLVTPTGQLSTSFGSETVHRVNRARAEELLAPKRPIRTRAELLRMQAQLREDVRAVARVTAVPGAEPPAAQVTSSTARPGYRLDAITFEAEEGIELTGLLAVPERAGLRPAILMMASEPKEVMAAPGGEVDRLARAGWIVLVLQARGTPGGTEEIKSPLLGTYYLLSLRALLVGKTIVGMRTDDAIRVVDWLASRPDVDPSALAAYAAGPLGPVLLHAAVLDDRIRTIYVESTLTAYRQAVERPIHRELPEIALPGVLRRYDLGDLLLAASPRRVVVINPVNSVGGRVREQEFRSELDYVFQSDRNLGSPDRVLLRSRGPRDPLPVDEVR